MPRRKPLAVRITPPQHGWLEVRVVSPTVEFALVASHTPSDALTELAAALLTHLHFRLGTAARLHGEPEQWSVRFERADSAAETTLRIVEERGSRPAREAFAHHCESRFLGRAFWRAFRRIEPDLPTTHWAHAFPTQLVTQLGAHTRPPVPLNRSPPAQRT